MYYIYFTRIIVFRFNYDIVGVVIHLRWIHRLKINIFYDAKCELNIAILFWDILV